MSVMVHFSTPVPDVVPLQANPFHPLILLEATIANPPPTSFIPNIPSLVTSISIVGIELPKLHRRG